MVVMPLRAVPCLLIYIIVSFGPPAKVALLSVLNLLALLFISSSCYSFLELTSSLDSNDFFYWDSFELISLSLKFSSTHTW